MTSNLPLIILSLLYFNYQLSTHNCDNLKEKQFFTFQQNDTILLKQEIDSMQLKYGALKAYQWSDKVKGSVYKVKIPDNNKKKVIFLTFDACGQGGTSDGFDSTLVKFLIQEKIQRIIFPHP